MTTSNVDLEVIMETRPVYLTVPEVAKLLRLTRVTTYKKIRRGDIPSLRLGGPIRVPASAILGPTGELPDWATRSGEAKEKISKQRSYDAPPDRDD
jgi:excisionase family DNA binding protein